jgi:hypothetical protein
MCLTALEIVEFSWFSLLGGFVPLVFLSGNLSILLVQ